MAVLVVEQNANAALGAAARAPTCSRRGRVAVEGTSEALRENESVRRLVPRVLRAGAVADFLQQVVSGLASGGIYASLALALVLIYRATGVVNFAQGEMAMFATFIAWSLMDRDMPYWPAFVLTLVIAFVGGAAIELAVIRPVQNAPPLTVVIVTDRAAHRAERPRARIWGDEPRTLESPFSTDPVRIGGVAFSAGRTSASSPSRSPSSGCCSRSSATRRSASACARRRSTRTRAGSSASGCSRCSRWGGAWPPCSARSPG